MCEAYLNEGDWDAPTEQTLWTDLDWKRFQDTPEFRRWAESPDAAEWGDKVGRGVASAFRAS
ncbi:MAG: hypothetical protein GWO24_26085, partial [Akkermansiaceae bacterium]|nr:hypothetical protein [Akkermansiaceae bacterium]